MLVVVWVSNVITNINEVKKGENVKKKKKMLL